MVVVKCLCRGVSCHIVTAVSSLHISDSLVLHVETAFVSYATQVDKLCQVASVVHLSSSQTYQV